MSKRIVTIAVVLLSSTPFCQAQSYFVTPHGVRAYHHASTWHQGVLDGAANYKGAIGRAIYMQSLANYMNEQALQLRSNRYASYAKAKSAAKAQRKARFEQLREERKHKYDNRRAERLAKRRSRNSKSK